MFKQLLPSRWAAAVCAISVFAFGLTVNADIFVADAIEGKTLDAFPNSTGIEVGGPATSAAWSHINSVSPNPMYVQAGSEPNGVAPNQQTFHFDQNPAVSGSAIRARLTADTFLTKDDVALGGSVALKFSVKWNSIPEPGTEGLNISIRESTANKHGTLIRFLPPTPAGFYLVSGGNALFQTGPASSLVIDKWYVFEQTLDLNAGTYTTTVDVINNDGSIFATSSNSVVQGISNSLTGFNRIQFDIDGRSADLEINDISITFIPEPGTISGIGAGLLFFLRRRR